jgi:hypothetical protein
MTTGKLGAWGLPPSRLWRFGVTSLFIGLSRRSSRSERSRKSSQTISKSNWNRELGLSSWFQVFSPQCQLNILQSVVSPDLTHAAVSLRAFHPGQSPGPRRSRGKRIYGQASRLISIGKLNVSPRLHTRPITWSSSRSL